MKFRLVEELNINDINKLTLYRGSNVQSDKFKDYNEQDYKHVISAYGPGIYLCTDKEYAKTHGKYLYTVKIHCKKPLIIDSKSFRQDYYENPEFFDTKLTKENAGERAFLACKNAYNHGYDCIVFINEYRMKDNEIMVISLYNNILDIINVEENNSEQNDIVSGLPYANRLSEDIKDAEFYYNEILKNCFITDNLDAEGTSFWILPDGKLLWASNKQNKSLLPEYHQSDYDWTEHEVISKWLIKKYKLSQADSYKYGEDNIVDHNAIRCSFIGSSISLPKDLPTNEQFESMKMFMDYLCDDGDVVNVGTYNNSSWNEYDFADGYTPDDVLKRIKRYYSSGTLYS